MEINSYITERHIRCKKVLHLDFYHSLKTFNYLTRLGKVSFLTSDKSSVILDLSKEGGTNVLFVEQRYVTCQRK